MSFVEPTAAAILAFSQDAGDAGVVQRARDYLTELQRADGGWGIAALDDESGWMTAWAVWSLAGADRGAAGRGADWLLGTAGIRVSSVSQVEGIGRVLKIDATITGWPWQKGDAAWVFPTALALLALHAMGEEKSARAQEGIGYLLNRAIPTGGWNIGNPYMVTGTLSPTVENTAVALAALGAYEVEADAIRAGEEWLAREDFTKTAFEWAWRGWYWKRKNALHEGVKKALEKIQLEDGSFDHSPFTTALAAIAEL